MMPPGFFASQAGRHALCPSLSLKVQAMLQSMVVDVSGLSTDYNTRSSCPTQRKAPLVCLKFAAYPPALSVEASDTSLLLRKALDELLDEIFEVPMDENREVIGHVVMDGDRIRNKIHLLADCSQSPGDKVHIPLRERKQGTPQSIQREACPSRKARYKRNGAPQLASDSCPRFNLQCNGCLGNVDSQQH